MVAWRVVHMVVPGSETDGCDCEFFKSEGVCKHSVRVQQEIEQAQAEDEARTAAMIARFDIDSFDYELRRNDLMELAW